MSHRIMALSVFKSSSRRCCKLISCCKDVVNLCNLSKHTSRFQDRTQYRSLHTLHHNREKYLLSDGHLPKVLYRNFFNKSKSEITEGPGIPQTYAEEMKEETSALKRVIGMEKFVHKVTLRKSGLSIFLSVSEIIDPEFWFRELELPDTFNSFFLVLELHMWLIITRLSREGKKGSVVMESCITAFWDDIEVKMKKVPGRIETLKVLAHMDRHFQTACLTYEEGLLGSDSDLAQSVWNTMYDCADVSPRALEVVVMYIRKQIQHLDRLDSSDLIVKGFCPLLPLYLNEINPEAYRDVSSRVQTLTKEKTSAIGVFRDIFRIEKKEKRSSEDEDTSQPETNSVKSDKNS